MSVLVFGFYGKSNLGDDLFCDAFKLLFPHINFIFSDIFTVDNVKDASAIFIGGGSFLFADPCISEECLNIVKTKKIFYVGVGVETEIHPLHKDLMMLARLIAVRSPKDIDKIKALNDNIIVIPDLIYSLKAELKNKKPNSALILPNISVIPQNTDEHWKHNSWQHFKFEFGQFLDYLIESGVNINFFSMCNNNEQNDDWAAYELIASMKNRDDYIIRAKSSNVIDITNLFSQYDTIITQRFHGIIIGKMLKIPTIIIAHHDKLKVDDYLSFFEISKQSLLNKLYSIRSEKINIMQDNSFDELVSKINFLLEN